MPLDASNMRLKVGVVLALIAAGVPVTREIMTKSDYERLQAFERAAIVNSIGPIIDQKIGALSVKQDTLAKELGELAVRFAALQGSLSSSR